MTARDISISSKIATLALFSVFMAKATELTSIFPHGDRVLQNTISFEVVVFARPAKSSFCVCQNVPGS